jgi:hypothetical protein
VRARRERHDRLTIFLLQECTVRYGHLDNCVGCENLGDTQERHTYADLVKRKCTDLCVHPTKKESADRSAHAANYWPHAIAYEPAVQSVLPEAGSRTLRVHHLREAAYPIGSELHTMQMLASFEPQKFRSEGRAASQDPWRMGARPARAPAPSL